jgi:hypothetical protein
MVGNVNNDGTFYMTITMSGSQPRKETGTMAWNNVAHLLATDTDSNSFNLMSQ